MKSDLILENILKEINKLKIDTLIKKDIEVIIHGFKKFDVKKLKLKRETPWSMYLRHQFKEIGELYVRPQELIALAGRTWKTLDNETKSMYKKKAKKQNEVHMSIWKERQEKYSFPYIDHDAIKKMNIQDLYHHLQGHSIEFNQHETKKTLIKKLIDAKIKNSEKYSIKKRKFEIDEYPNKN